MRYRSRRRLNDSPAGFTQILNGDGSVYMDIPAPNYQRKVSIIEDFHQKKKRLASDGFNAVEDGLTPVSDLYLKKIHVKGSFTYGQLGRRKFVRVLNPVSRVVPQFAIPSESECRNRFPGYVNKLLAKTNPSRFEVSAVVMAAELLEVATLFKFAAGSFVGQVAGNYLNIQFGWKPFLADLKKLNSITKLIESRMLELESMGKHGGLRRTAVFLDSVPLLNELHPFYSGGDAGQPIKGPFHRKAKYTVRGSVRWGYKGSPPPMDKISSFNLALSKVLDLEVPDPSTVWELVPFSWLVDYFLDIESWLGATSGFLEYYPFDVCITWHGIHTDAWSPNESDIPPGIQCTGSGTKVTEVRRLTAHRPSVEFPTLLESFLSDTQQANVIALLTALSSGLTTRR